MEKPEDHIVSGTFHLVKKFGVRNFSMDMLVRETGFSKKIIYQYFSSKEDVLTECITHLTGQLEAKNMEVIKSDENPVVKVIRIMDHNLSMGLSFRDSFLFEMKKYHTGIYHLINDYTEKLFDHIILSLLDEAHQHKMLIALADTRLFCEMHMTKVRDAAANAGYYNTQGYDHVFRHLVVFPLRGILRPEHFEVLKEWERE